MDLIKKNELLDTAQKLSRNLKVNYLALCRTLFEVKESEAYKEAGFKDWVMYYRDELDLVKDGVSKMLPVGEWLSRNDIKLPLATPVGYRKLAIAIKANPNKDPDFILASADRLTTSELLMEKTETEFGKDHLHSSKDGKTYKKCICGIFYAI